MLELYHWEPNNASLRCLVALEEKGLPFTSHYVDFAALEHYTLAPFTDNAEAAYALEGEAPVLLDGASRLSDSLFIDLYLDEAYPAAPLRPASPADRWRVLMWARLFAEVLAPAVSTLGCQRYLLPALARRDAARFAERLAKITMLERRQAWEKLLGGGVEEPLLADSRRKVTLAIGRVESALAAGPWLAGPAYSLADIDCFSLAYALPTLTPELVNPQLTPRVCGFIERVAARPAVRAALARSRTGHPEQAFVPGPEHSRWG